MPRHVVPSRIRQLRLVHHQRVGQGCDRRGVPGRQQEQRGTSCGEDVQSAEPHAAARRAGAGVRGPEESQAREHREAAGDRGGAGWQGKGDRYGALHRWESLQHPGRPGEYVRPRRERVSSGIGTLVRWHETPARQQFGSPRLEARYFTNV